MAVHTPPTVTRTLMYLPEDRHTWNKKGIQLAHMEQTHIVCIWWKHNCFYYSFKEHCVDWEIHMAISLQLKKPPKQTQNFHRTGTFRYCSPLLKPLYQYCLGQVVILLEMRDTSHAEAPYWEPQVLQWTHLNWVAPSNRWGTSYSLEGLHFYFYIFILSFSLVAVLMSKPLTCLLCFFLRFSKSSHSP